MREFTKEFQSFATSLGIQISVIVNQAQLAELKALAPTEYARKFQEACSGDFQDLPVVVMLGVFGYDEEMTQIGRQSPNVGLTGSHQNYWKLGEEVGPPLLEYLQKRGFRGKFNGEFSCVLPIKFLLNRLGIGKYGKNSIIYVDGYGSYLNNWVELFTDAPLQPTASDVLDDYQGMPICETCDACVKVCPTKAIHAPYKVEEDLCITNLTHCIETVPRHLWPIMRNWIWGCNECQRVCPANAQVRPRHRHPNATLSHPGPRGGLPPAHRHPFPKLAAELIEGYNTKYLQNVLIALGNCGVREDVVHVERFARTLTGQKLEEYCQYAVQGIVGRTPQLKNSRTRRVETTANRPRFTHDIRQN